MVRRARKIWGALDWLPKSQTSFDVTIVVAVDRDDAAKDEEVRNRTAKARPESIPGTRFGIGTGVAQEPMSRVGPEDNYDYQEADCDQ